MKRIIKTCLIGCLLWYVFSTSVFAAENTYYLDEMAMSITVSDNHIVFTRDTDEKDPNLIMLGITKSELLSFMYQYNIYLDVCDSDFKYEVEVAIEDSLVTDFNDLGDTALLLLSEGLAEQVKNSGTIYLSSEVYQHSQTKFLKILMTQSVNEISMYELQYITVINGKAATISINAQSEETILEEESLLKGMIDSIDFDAIPEPSDPPVQTPAFTYTDANSGLMFTVPENWAEEPLNEERDYIDAKFISKLKEPLSIVYTSEDLWSLFTESEKQQYSRKDIDNTYITKTEFAAMNGCKEEDVFMASFAGKEYFCAEIMNTGAADGVTFSMPMTVLTRFENGYVYIFQFSGMYESTCYEDFEFLMNSVIYPAESEETSEEIKEEVMPDFDFEISKWQNQGAIVHPQMKEPLSIDSIFLNLCLTILIYTIPIVIYRYAIIKKPVDKKKAKIITIIWGIIAFIGVSVIMVLTRGSGTAGVRYCCGARLITVF